MSQRCDLVNGSFDLVTTQATKICEEDECCTANDFGIYDCTKNSSKFILCTLTISSVFKDNIVINGPHPFMLNHMKSFYAYISNCKENFVSISLIALSK